MPGGSSQPFANKVILKIVGQSAPDFLLKDGDYDLIRSTFKELGGSWFLVVNGDVDHIRLLKETIRVWVSNHATH